MMRFPRHTQHHNYQQPHPDSSTTKIPPYWQPTMETEYPFRIWLQDINLWIHSTEVPAERQAPAIVLRLGGTARALAREIPAETLARGDRIQDPAGQLDEQGQVAMIQRYMIRTNCIN